LTINKNCLNTHMEKYTTDFNNTDIDSGLLNKIISSNDEIPETKHEDVTEQYSKKAYILPYKTPIILYKSKVYEARKTVFTSKKELEKYLKSERGILVLEIFERDGKYMLRHFVSGEDNLKISLIGHLKMKIMYKIKSFIRSFKS